MTDEIDGDVVGSGPSMTRGAAENPTLVFVHGGCHGSWQWEHWQRWFSGRGWNSVAVDWSHHDQSPARRESRDWLRRGLLDVSEDVASAVAAAGPNPVLIGHSMGGFASLRYGCSSGSAVSGLVLFTPVLPRAFGGEPIELDVDLDRPWGPPPPDEARELFYSGVDDTRAQRYFARLQPETPQAVWEATRWTLDVDVTGLDVPTFVVAAERDRLTPAARVRDLAHAIDADFTELPGVGHGVTLDPGWAALAEQLEAWIRRRVLGVSEPSIDEGVCT